MLLDEDQFLFIVLFLTILFLCVILCLVINRSNAKDYPNEGKYVNSCDMQNGDLVFCSYNNFAGSFVTSFSGSIWSHPGMIWVDPETDVRFVIEGAIYSHKEYKHFMKIPIETWLSFNHKSIIGYKKYLGPDIDSEIMRSIFEPYFNNSKLEGFSVSWAKFLLDKEYYEYGHQNKLTCVEFTSILGQELNIFKKDKIYCSYFPDHMANDKIELMPGVFYGKTIITKAQIIDDYILKKDKEKFIDFWKN